MDRHFRAARRAENEGRQKPRFLATEVEKRQGRRFSTHLARRQKPRFLPTEVEKRQGWPFRLDPQAGSVPPPTHVPPAIHGWIAIFGPLAGPKMKGGKNHAFWRPRLKNARDGVFRL